MPLSQHDIPRKPCPRKATACFHAGAALLCGALGIAELRHGSAATALALAGGALAFAGAALAPGGIARPVRRAADLFRHDERRHPLGSALETIGLAMFVAGMGSHYVFGFPLAA